MKKIAAIILLSLFVFGCSKHTIKYSLSTSDIKPDKSYILALESFKDKRPEEERTRKIGKFLKFASKDSHFKKSITESLKEILKEELLEAGLRTPDYNAKEKVTYDYIVSGTVFHYHAALQLPKTTVVPYLRTVASIWTKDEFIIAIEININLIDNENGKMLLNKTYVFTEDKKLPSGLFNLARYSRGFNYKLKLLDEALSSVVEDIRNDILNIIKSS